MTNDLLPTTKNGANGFRDIEGKLRGSSERGWEPSEFQREGFVAAVYDRRWWIELSELDVNYHRPAERPIHL